MKIHRLPYLTAARLEAIEESIAHRLAGPLDNDIERAEYETALAWVRALIRIRAERRRARK
jgi:hypothetical protein